MIRRPDMPSPTARLEALQRVDDDRLDLATVALDIANLAFPKKSIKPYQRHLNTLCKDVGVFAGKQADVKTAAYALSHILGRRYGYGGTEDMFDDLETSNMMTVIDDRCGLPVALGILYIHVARAQGWLACGIDFPRRSMVRIEVNGERAILNPFDGGRLMQSRDLRDILKAVMGTDAELKPDYYRTLDNRGILMRLGNTLKARHLHAERLDAALETIDSMLLLMPDDASLWREAGVMHIKLDHIPAAIAALEEYLRLETSNDNRYTASLLLQHLRTQL